MSETNNRPIDFDEQFQIYLARFAQRNRTKYRTPERIEALVPDLYEKWINTPKKWLADKSPKAYFEAYTDPMVLVDLMRTYAAYDITPPSLLLDRLTELDQADKVVAPLVTDGDPQLAKLAIEILKELDSNIALSEYLRMLEAHNRPEEVQDAVVEVLGQKADIVKEDLLAMMDMAQEASLQADIMDVLVKAQPDERVFKWLLRLFNNSLSQTGLYAAYLGSYGNMEAIEPLTKALDRPGIGYMDYCEVVYALEALGEEVNHERDFTGDPAYEALKGMGD